MTGSLQEARQVVLREVNDRIYEILESFGAEDGNFVCECGTEACAEPVKITLREYAAFRSRDYAPSSLRSRACPGPPGLSGGFAHQFIIA
jgi:hypothetical protein